MAEKQVLTLRKETIGKLAELGAEREVGFMKMWKKDISGRIG